ncbi:MAG TPA: IclR family transcriptional regulator, partial [Chloroflexi bacterium]|nr:IclR family transcriptional regulator [Chloroflexota bacterium]
YQVLQVGSLLPLHATAMGKTLLAANPYLIAQLGPDDLTRFTPSTITDPKRLSHAATQARRLGWAADIGELVDGEGSVAAPILDRREQTVGAISISGPVERLCESQTPRSDLVSYVRESARAISRDLGAIPW